jgi:putative oxidoreductase
VLRVIAGLLFIQFGGLILFGWFGGIPEQPGTPPLMSQAGIGWLICPFWHDGGCVLAVSRTKWRVAGSEPGVPAVLFCFLYLYMAARGGGDWSLDALLRLKNRDNHDCAAE